MNHLPSWRYLAFLVFLSGIVLTVGIGLVLWANGYQLIWQPPRLVKAGILQVHVRPEQGVIATLDGQSVTLESLAALELTPGRYTLSLKRPDLATWEETFVLAGGSAIRLPDIVLFYQTPQPVLVTDASERERLHELLSGSDRFRQDLQIFGSEVWTGDHLITRYGKPVSQALWLPGKTHLVLLVDSQLHVLELSGRHDQTVLNFAAGDVVSFAPIKFGLLALEVNGNLSTVLLTDRDSLFESSGLRPAVEVY